MPMVNNMARTWTCWEPSQWAEDLAVFCTSIHSGHLVNLKMSFT